MKVEGKGEGRNGEGGKKERGREEGREWEEGEG